MLSYVGCIGYCHNLGYITHCDNVGCAEINLVILRIVMMCIVVSTVIMWVILRTVIMWVILRTVIMWIILRTVIIGFKIYYFKSFIAGGYTLLGRCGLV